MTFPSKGRIKDLLFLPLLLKALDMVLIYASLFMLTLFFPYIEWVSGYKLLALLSILIYLFAAESVHLYQSWRGVDFTLLVKRVLIIWFVTVTCLMILGYISKVTAEYSRILVSIWFILVPILLLLWRAVFKGILNYFRSKGYNTRQVAVLGVNGLANQLIGHIEKTQSLGMILQGLYDDRGEERHAQLVYPILGNTDALVKNAQSGKIDLIYITLPMKAEERIKEVVNKLADTTVTVYLVPDLYTYQLFNGSWTNMAGHPIISVFESPFLGLNSYAKRAQDIVLSIIILTIVSPVMLVISAGIKLTSKGPVLFKQRRYGISGEEITVWKFRSMTTQDNGNNIKQATKDDARIRPLGSFLRRTSLDELPQFFNVLMGDMSIVGPSPHAVAHNELYRNQIRGYMLRHAVKPGITGWAQVNGWRGETEKLEEMEGRIEHDLWYIGNWSNWLDIKIICMTMFKVIKDRKAY